MKTNVKKLLLLFLVLVFWYENAFSIIIPMPIFHSGIEGADNGNIKRMIALWITFNLVFLAIFILRFLIWIALKDHLKNREWTFFEYTIWSTDKMTIWRDGDELHVQDFNAMFFACVNGLGISLVILFSLASWISKNI